MILNDSELESRIYQLFDFEKTSSTKEEVFSQINPNSIDLTLDRHIMYMKEHQVLIYGEDSSNCWKSLYYSDGDYLTLLPNECVLCCTREYVIMPPDLCGQLFTKSSFGRIFVNHMMAGVIDAGFEGKITLEFKNDSPNVIQIPFGARVVQMVYSELCKSANLPYNQRKSRYCFADKCEPSKKEVKNDEKS